MQDEEFIVSSSGDFVPAPDGVHQAVCVDLYPLKVRSAFKVDQNGQPTMVDKVMLVFELDALMEDGKRFTASKLYTPSLHAKAALRQDLKGWRGRDFTPEELAKFNLAQVVGAPCTLVIQHDTKQDGDVRAKIITISRADPARKIAPSGKYTRKKDRPQEQGAAPAQQQMNGHAAPATSQQPVEDKPPF